MFHNLNLALAKSTNLVDLVPALANDAPNEIVRDEDLLRLLRHVGVDRDLGSHHCATHQGWVERCRGGRSTIRGVGRRVRGVAIMMRETGGGARGSSRTGTATTAAGSGRTIRLCRRRRDGACLDQNIADVVGSNVNCVRYTRDAQNSLENRGIPVSLWLCT